MPRPDADLTPRQRDVLAALLARHERGLEPPSLDALCRTLRLRSRGSLHKHVSALAGAGLVEPLAGRGRGVRLTARALPEDAGLPLLGDIAAGRPIEAIETPESVEVPAWLRGRGRCYVLRVRGDSMVDDGILDGDLVVVESRDQARDRELVVALVDGADATLKRIEQRPGRCTLHPANAAHEPQVYSPDRVAVQGVVVAQLRRYG